MKILVKWKAKRFLTMVLFSTVALVALGIIGCSTEETTTAYEHISPQKAKSLMESESGYLILDVRSESEFAGGHIPGAMLIPDDEIQARAQSELKDKNRLILVYCRSGRRSQKAAQILADLGYTNVKEFGGILDWEYETVID